jgi:hypothetical protein
VTHFSFRGQWRHVSVSQKFSEEKHETVARSEEGFA